MAPILRKRKAFAWLPINTSDGKRIWLKRYLVLESFYPMSPGYPGVWFVESSWSKESEEWKGYRP